MNFLKALKKVVKSNGKLWARPIGTTGWGVDLKGEEFICVPSARGGEPMLIPSVSFLFRDWEVLAPVDILKEMR